MSLTMEKARAPKAGYDTDEKAKYREDVWIALAPIALEMMTDPRAHCLIMPSREGLEIDVAVKRGIPPERIVCVDQSAAVIATSTWRKKWPQCKFFASKISEVGKKLRKHDMFLAAANLDLCGNFSDETIAEIDGFLNTAPVFAGYGLSITMMRGREGAVAARMLARCGASHFAEKRFNGLYVETAMRNDHWLTLAEGFYKSGKMPVAWVAIQHVKQEPDDVYKEYITDDLIQEVKATADLQLKGFDLWDDVGGKRTFTKYGHLDLRYMNRRFKQYTQYQELMNQMDERIKKTLSRVDRDVSTLTNRCAVYDKIVRELECIHKEHLGYRCPSSVRKSSRGWKF